jgi:DNA-binding NarL/FixJ family response regulator
MKLRVLIADDHVLFREGLRALLARDPEIEVVAEAGDGRSAVRMALELLPDVVMMDLTMPEMNGIEATRQIVGNNGGIGILVLSMESERRFVVASLKAGAKGYLLKDSAFAELTTALRTVAAGEPYLSPKVANLVIKEFMERGPEDETQNSRRLTERECEVLKMIADGMSTKEISLASNVSTKTIDSQRNSIMKKLDLYSIAQLTKYAIHKGISTL